MAILAWAPNVRDAHQGRVAQFGEVHGHGVLTLTNNDMRRVC